MANFPARLEALKRQVGGNREKMDFEWTFLSSLSTYPFPLFFEEWDLPIS